jgi:hypothetical protein
MPNCPNCVRERQGGMRFCPNCGQDQSVVVPQDQRISTEDVPVPPPPKKGSPRGGGRRKLIIGLLGLGGLVALLLVALLVVAVVSGSTNQTAQSGGGGQENGGSEEKEAKEEKKKSEPKKKSGPENVAVAVGETAELQDRNLVVNEAQHGYPLRRGQKLEPDSELLRVYITLKNTGNQPINYNPLDFKVQDSNGVQKNYEGMSDLPYRLEYGSLAPDGTVEGNLAFEVPQGDNNLQLVYQANQFQRQTITIGPL